MTARTIWIVEGACGEYSDHNEWIVAAYENEADAQEHVIKAKEAGNARRAGRAAKGFSFPSYIRGEAATPYDPDFDWDYTGFEYCCYAVTIYDNVAAYLAAPKEQTP